MSDDRKYIIDSVVNVIGKKYPDLTILIDNEYNGFDICRDH